MKDTDNEGLEIFYRVKPPNTPEGIIQFLGLIAADSRYRKLSRFEQMQEIIEKYLAYQRIKK